jgi:hypothetical protein
LEKKMNKLVIAAVLVTTSMSSVAYATCPTNTCNPNFGGSGHLDVDMGSKSSAYARGDFTETNSKTAGFYGFNHTRGNDQNGFTIGQVNGYSSESKGWTNSAVGGKAGGWADWSYDVNSWQ